MKKRIRDFIHQVTKDWMPIHTFGAFGIIVVVTFGTIVIVSEKCDAIHERNHNEYMIEQCLALSADIKAVDEQTNQLEGYYHDNICNIYDRILVITEESPDEVRDKVIHSVASLHVDMDNTVKFEAFVLVLLRNYEELENDIQIQTYLNNNVEILSKINENNELRKSLNTALQLFESEYIDANTDVTEQ